MTKILKDLIDEGVLKNVETFSKKTESEMLFNSSLTGDSLDFEWVDVVTNALPYLDNIVRNPKLTLITEQNIEKIMNYFTAYPDLFLDIIKPVDEGFTLFFY